jgi:hypothetical protein
MLGLSLSSLVRYQMIHGGDPWFFFRRQVQCLRAATVLHQTVCDILAEPNQVAMTGWQTYTSHGKRTDLGDGEIGVPILEL